METVMHIGAKVEKKDADNFAGAITEIFKSGFDYHMDQEVIGDAISAFARVFEVKQVTVKDSNFIGEDKRVIVNHADEEKSDAIKMTE